MNKMIFHMPTIYSVSSKGKVKEWTVSVNSNRDGTATIVREHGYHGEKIQVIEKIIRKGKNLGKANETSPYEQAVSEAMSLRQKRLDTGYTESMPNPDTHHVELPMLAQPFEKSKHRIVYGAYVQPKLNGVRCLAKKVDEKTITYMSRKGKTYDTLDHLTPTLLKVMKVGQIFDGEIYIHGKTFQHIVRLVKKLRPESKTLQYHVYDIADATLPFKMRTIELHSRLGNFLPESNREIVLVQTGLADDEAAVKSFHDAFVREGYEGVIIRNADGKYKFDNRSADLQKYKEFFDEEFTIVGGKEGTGLHEGCVIFEVETDSGNTFNVYPRGSLEQRREMFENLDDLIGKQLTVRYQEKSEDGIPIFPVGIVVRDYE